MLDCYQCQSGSLNCLYPPEYPEECFNYLILKDSTRNVRHRNAFYGDHDDCSNECFNTSPDWQGGNNWYRMMPPAGIVIPQTSVKMRHCGTAYPGWIRGTHPTDVGQQVKVEVCYSADNGNGDDCAVVDGSILVTNCEAYYVYLLTDINVGCGNRYCAADNL